MILLAVGGHIVFQVGHDISLGQAEDEISFLGCGQFGACFAELSDEFLLHGFLLLLDRGQLLLQRLSHQFSRAAMICWRWAVT